MWDPSYVLADDSVDIWVSNGSLHFHCHEFIMNWLLVCHVRLVGVINLVSKRFVLFLLLRLVLVSQLLIDLLEILLARLNEVLLLRARPVGLLHFMSSVSCSCSYLVTILQQIHLKLVLSLQQILRKICWLSSLIELRVRSIVGDWV